MLDDKELARFLGGQEELQEQVALWYYLELRQSLSSRCSTWNIWTLRLADAAKITLETARSYRAHIQRSWSTKMWQPQQSTWMTGIRQFES